MDELKRKELFNEYYKILKEEAAKTETPEMFKKLFPYDDKKTKEAWIFTNKFRFAEMINNEIEKNLKEERSRDIILSRETAKKLGLPPITEIKHKTTINDLHNDMFHRPFKDPLKTIEIIQTAALRDTPDDKAKIKITDTCNDIKVSFENGDIGQAIASAYLLGKHAAMNRFKKHHSKAAEARYKIDIHSTKAKLKKSEPLRKKYLQLCRDNSGISTRKINDIFYKHIGKTSIEIHRNTLLSWRKKAGL